MAQLIGITGGIGSGKTTIAKGLQTLGYAVYFTDNEAKRLLQTDPVLIAQVKALLGEEAYSTKQDGKTAKRQNGKTANQQYNTAFVASKVFYNAELLARLNALVHPAVCKDVQIWAAQQATVCFVESAILFESGLAELCDKVVAVVAPENIRLQRAMQRDHANEDSIRQRMAAQMSDNELQSRAEIVINNDGITPIPALLQQIIDKL